MRNIIAFVGVCLCILALLLINNFYLTVSCLVAAGVITLLLYAWWITDMIKLARKTKEEEMKKKAISIIEWPTMDDSSY